MLRSQVSKYATVIPLILTAVACINIFSAEGTTLPFSVNVPSGSRIEKTYEMEDFDIYTISSGSIEQVKVYVGNHPDTKDIERRATSIMDAGPVMIFSRYESGKLTRRDMVVDLRESAWPAYVHAWTLGETPEEVTAADRLLLNLKVELAEDE